jgi:hypothetical protein
MDASHRRPFQTGPKVRVGCRLDAETFIERVYDITSLETSTVS